MIIQSKIIIICQKSLFYRRNENTLVISPISGDSIQILQTF